jgi:hypothetical protein
VAAFALAGAARVAQLGQPFGYGFDGWVGAVFGNAARHYVRDGFGALRLAPYLDPGPRDPGRDAPYLHHPPTVPLIAGLSVSVGGLSEEVLRLGPSLAMLLSVWLLFRIGRRELGPRHGALAALAFAALPMTIVFGGIVNFEPWVLAAMLGVWWSWRVYDEAPSAGRLALLVALFVTAVALDWFGAYVGVAVAGDALLRRERRWRAPLIMFAASVAVVALALVWFAWVQPDSLAELRAWAQHRTGDSANDVGDVTYTVGGWFGRQAMYLRTLFGPWGVGLAIGVAGPIMARRRAPRAARTAALLLVPGCLSLAVFPQASYLHGFFGYPLSAGLALGIGLAAVMLSERTRGRPLARFGGGACLAFALGAALLSGWAALLGRPVVTGGARVAGVPVPSSFHIPPAGVPTGLQRALGRELAALVPWQARVAVPGVDLNLWVPVGFYADRRIVYEADSVEDLARLGATHLAIPGQRLGSWAALVEAVQRRGATASRGELLVVIDLGAVAPPAVQ